MVFTAVAAVGIAFTFLHSAPQRLNLHQADLQHACGQLKADIQQLFPKEEQTQSRVTNPELLQQQIVRVVSKYQGVEGGFWQLNSHFFGYTFPTYIGSEIKVDVPETEKTLLSSISQRAIEQGKTVTSVQRNSDNAVIAVACPIATHESLSAWLMQKVSLVPTAITVVNGILFIALGMVALTMLMHAFRFEKRWYLERDRIVKQGEDDSKPIPVTSNINEIQPLLMLLYQARQKNVNLERTISALEAKLSRTKDLSTVARISATFAKELAARIEQLKTTLLTLTTEQQQVDELQRLKDEFERIENLISAFENLDLEQSGKSGTEWVNLQFWLDTIAAYHQERTARDTQTVTAVCTENLSLHSHLLLLRFAIDTLIAHAVTFGPERAEILLKGSLAEDTILIEVIDEFEGLSTQRERQLFRHDDVLPETYGQGLKLVKEALDAIGATIAYEADGENSRFIVQIPMTST